jgi:leucyl-tRNA synthetase
MGLVYRGEADVNWDPVDQTVLANEQVIEGRGWRSGALVERRKLSQWFFRITQFADELLHGLDELERWPEKVRIMQRNWIGRSEGLRFSFDVKNAPASAIEVFSTRPDTLFGASFIALSPDHPLTEQLAAKDAKLAAFVAECKRGGTAEEAIETAEKLGYDTGLRALHPFDAGWELPVYVANFVLMAYGTGAIFGCPAHDQRDLDFARKYRLPVVPVVIPDDADPATFAIGSESYVGPGHLANSRFLDGMDVERAKSEVAGRLEAAGKGKRTVHYRLRDWLVSRQRYWGCPYPDHPLRRLRMVPVAEQDLPVKLPDDVRFDMPGNPLALHPTWKHTHCPKCGGAAERETDTVRHVRRFVLVFRALHRFARGGAGEPRRRRAIGCPSTSTSAVSSTRSCICSMRGSSRARWRRRVMSRSGSRLPDCSRKAWSATKPIAARTANGSCRKTSRSATAVRSCVARARRSTSARPRKCRSRRRT